MGMEIGKTVTEPTEPTETGKPRNSGNEPDKDQEGVKDLGELSRQATQLSDSLKEEMGKSLVGMENLSEHLLACLLAGGHAVLEGVPGVAKTTLAKRFAESLELGFKRIQFTPDLLPADILGNYVYSPATGSFTLRQGPIFSNIILADEINRSPPKTQSALLECMQEGQATIEGTTMPMEKPFMVLATQNPIELEGTYPLPEAEIDRFLFKLRVGYPDEEGELEMLKKKNSAVDQQPPGIIATPSQLTALRRAASMVHVEEMVLRYIRDITLATRHNENISLGASPRASEHFLRSAKARALIQGREYVTPDDVKALAQPVLLHRLVLTVDAELGEITQDAVIEQVLSTVPVPRK